MTVTASVFPRTVRGATRAELALVTEARLAGYWDCSDVELPADADDMQSLNSQFDLLGRLIDATEVRHRAISNNIANVNTSNYRRMDVEFEEQLARELSSSKNSNGSSEIKARPEMVLTPGLTARADGNNVDIDREIGQLNKNAMLQQTYVQLLSTYLEQMRLAIQG
ncbi:MAG: flagellar basal body rod protein FlgB [Fuerstia sp.]|nr:flagellar basal body rod protein FlgB [Fuerstiella sp.]